MDAVRFVAGEIEPSIAGVAGRVLADPGDEYWRRFRACPVCRAAIGRPCRALNGRVVGGRPDGVCTPLPRAHSSRQPRTGRRFAPG